jgi:hypothetical protein
MPPQAEGWVPEEIGRCPERDDPPCKNGRVLGKRQKKSDQGQRGTRKLEKMDVRKAVSAKTGTQKWDKEQRDMTAVTKQERIHQDLQENH